MGVHAGDQVVDDADDDDQLHYVDEDVRVLRGDVVLQESKLFLRWHYLSNTTCHLFSTASLV